MMTVSATVAITLGPTRASAFSDRVFMRDSSFDPEWADANESIATTLRADRRHDAERLHEEARAVLREWVANPNRIGH